MELYDQFIYERLIFQEQATVKKEVENDLDSVKRIIQNSMNLMRNDDESSIN